jgi:hypothetical protein
MALRQEHEYLDAALDRLREIAELSMMSIPPSPSP